ncbi:MAG: toll/interleukin-1 receptor domain-containing protein [Leptolyngbya sp. RL_3_1]|nr:toll/interleukin-1 receptor domain-containing protein [Leptolyngbya sp. RL_3_1]
MGRFGSDRVTKNFFVSYNSADKTWAEWIAWILEEQNYSVVIQAWDFRPGGNFILDMQQATEESDRTIMVLSEAYLKASYTQPEWAAAFKQDPESTARKVIPIRVGDCTPKGMLAPLVYVDLVGKDEAMAEQLVLAALQERAKPATRPGFPGSATAEERVTPEKVSFPGGTSQTTQPTTASKPLPPKEKVTLTPRERLALSRQITGLTVQDFNDLLLLLDPPAGLIPPPSTQQGDRVYALLNWAQSTTGPGLGAVQAALADILPQT